MQVDRHQPICEIIDKSLVGTASLQEEQALREHLGTCTACNEYLETSNRAIAGLGGFSFAVDPGLEERVLASLARRQLDAKQIRPVPLWWSRLVALVLTVTGSLAAYRVAGLTAPLLQVEPAQIQMGLIAFWIAPSVCLCLLLLLFPVSPTSWMNKKGLLL
jgi:anti-sigma factor RsiW